MVEASFAFTCKYQETMSDVMEHLAQMYAQQRYWLKAESRMLESCT